MPKPLNIHRRAAFLTTRELAEKADVSPATIWRIERGDYKSIHPTTARKIAKALDIEPGEISEFILWQIDQAQSQS